VKKFFILITLVALCVGIYFVLWVGLREEYLLHKLPEVKEHCYAYKNDNDIKNIARLGVMQNLGGEQALRNQRRIVLSDRSTDDEYYLSGRPSGIIHYLIDYLFGFQYTSIAMITLVKDKAEHCLYIKEALYQKD